MFPTVSFSRFVCHVSLCIISRHLFLDMLCLPTSHIPYPIFTHSIYFLISQVASLFV